MCASLGVEIAEWSYRAEPACNVPGVKMSECHGTRPEVERYGGKHTVIKVVAQCGDTSEEFGKVAGVNFVPFGRIFREHACRIESYFNEHDPKNEESYVLL